MSEVSAPAATPSAPSTSQPSTPAAGASVAPSQAVTPAPRARNNAGQFLTKEGSQGVAPADGQSTETPAEAEARKEAYRFKRSLKVFGKEEAVDLDEDGIARELQIKRALQKKVGEYEKGYTQAQKLVELAKADPDAFLRELGHDPEATARKRLAKQAALGAMSPEERELHELREFRQQAETRERERVESEKKARHEATTKRLVEENNNRFMKALESSDLPKSYESLFHIAETARIALDDGIEYSDAELVKETARRLDTLTDRYLGTLSGEALAKRLGPKRVQSLIAAEVARFEASQSFAPQAPKAEPVSETRDEYISPSEVNRRLREMRNAK